MSKVLSCDLCFDPMPEVKNFNEIIDVRHNNKGVDFTTRYIVCPMCFLAVSDEKKRDQLMVERYLLKTIAREYHEKYAQIHPNWVKNYDNVVKKLNSDNLENMTVTISKEKITYK